MTTSQVEARSKSKALNSRGMILKTLKVLAMLLKPAYNTAMVLGGIAGALVAVFGFLDVSGITDGQVRQVIEFPESFNELLNKGIQAIDKYLAECRVEPGGRVLHVRSLLRGVVPPTGWKT